MTRDDQLFPLFLNSAVKTALSPRIKPGETFGGVVGSAFGPVGYSAEGTVGRPSVIPL